MVLFRPGIPQPRGRHFLQRQLLRRHHPQPGGPAGRGRHPNRPTILRSRTRRTLSDRRDQIWHDNIAYLFPLATDVSLKNTAATGNRRNISHQPWAIDEEIERDTFTLWIDHGKNPRNATYAYIVVPGIAAHRIADYEAEAAISIVANTTALQAVTHRGLGQSQIVFHEPGQIGLSDDIVLTAEQPCMVILQTVGDRINRITVADPARMHPVLNFRINTQLETSAPHWTSRWNHTRQETQISVDLPTNEYAGQSRTLTLP